MCPLFCQAIYHSLFKFALTLVLKSDQLVSAKNTVLKVLKFHMEPDKTRKLQNDQI